MALECGAPCATWLPASPAKDRVISRDADSETEALTAADAFLQLGRPREHGRVPPGPSRLGEDDMGTRRPIPLHSGFSCQPPPGGFPPLRRLGFKASGDHRVSRTPAPGLPADWPRSLEQGFRWGDESTNPSLKLSSLRFLRKPRSILANAGFPLTSASSSPVLKHRLDCPRANCVGSGIEGPEQSLKGSRGWSQRLARVPPSPTQKERAGGPSIRPAAVGGSDQPQPHWRAQWVTQTAAPRI